MWTHERFVKAWRFTDDIISHSLFFLVSFSFSLSFNFYFHFTDWTLNSIFTQMFTLRDLCSNYFYLHICLFSALFCWCDNWLCIVSIYRKLMIDWLGACMCVYVCEWKPNGRLCNLWIPSRSLWYLYFDYNIIQLFIIK